MLDVGQSVEIYTILLRGMTQNSYPGQIIAVSDKGVTLKTSSGTVFFPFTSIERVMVKG